MLHNLTMFGGPSVDEILSIVVHAKDDAFQVALGAMGEAHKLVIEAKEVEVSILRKQVAELGEALRYERARADNLVDRLLVRDAKVAAVSPAAIEIAKAKDEETYKRLKETFEQLNDVGMAPVSVKEPRAFEMAGGSVVATHVQ